MVQNFLPVESQGTLVGTRGVKGPCLVLVIE
jgi:hypothetical protein